MPTIQVLSYSFEVSEPYAEGHRLNAAEAKALNSQRTDRLRNIVYKRLQAKSPQGMLLNANELVEFTKEVSELDSQFNFVSHKFVNKLQRNTLQGEIWEVAREAAAAAIKLAGGESPSDDEIDLQAEALVNDKNIIDEGRRRYEAFQEVTRKALSDLMG